MARFQSCGHGLYLVWSSSLDRGNLCLLDDPLHLAQLAKSSQHYAYQLWYEHERLCLIFHILVAIFASDMVPSAQDQTLVYRQELLCSDCCHCILHLGYC